MTTLSSATNVRPARWREWLASYGLLGALFVLMILFTALNPRFFTLANLGTMLEQNAPLFIIAVGATFAIISQNIDLSPASVLALAGVALGLVFQATGSLLLGIIAGFAAAIAVELFNAVLIVRGGINPLIVTLACWIWARGLAVSFTGANSILVRDPALDALTRPIALEISPAILLALLVFMAGGFILARTRLGRYTYAMGSDERATLQAGVPTG